MLERGEACVLATVIDLDGSPPSRAGAKLLMAGAAPVAGTLGCSEFDSAALADAAAVLAGGAPSIRTYHHDLGSIRAYLEPYAAAPLLIVLAATPVAAHLLRWAPEVGFRTVLVETRPGRLEGEWPAATVVRELAGLPAALAGEVYAVHTDHDAPDLVPALEIVLRSGPRFTGLMGSRRHTGHHLEALRAGGLPEADLARIQSPTGLDLGAQGAAEIALSILSGIVAARRGRAGGRL